MHQKLLASNFWFTTGNVDQLMNSEGGQGLVVVATKAKSILLAGPKNGGVYTMRYGKHYRMVLSLYLITGVLFVWYNFFKNYTLWHLLKALFPASIFVFVSFFFLYVGLSNLLSKGNNKSQKLLSIALLIQVVQFSFFGFVFTDYIGPYVSIGFYFEPVVKFDVDVSLYSWLFSNGYDENAQSKFFINLFPLLLLVLLKALHPSSEISSE